METEKSKKCPKCGLVKPHFEFNNSKSSRDGRTLWCKLCCNQYAKQYRKNKPNHLESRRSCERRRRKINLEYLSSLHPLKCIECGFDKYFEVLELHHLDPNQKEGKYDTLSRWLKNLGLEAFKRKIKSIEYELLCSTCHKVKHIELRDMHS
jgi:hypothetical protein